MSYIRLLASNWTNIIAWLFWNVVAMAGLWGTGLIIFFFLDNTLWLQLIDRGQLFLYSFGFLAQAMYVLSRDNKITTIPFRWVLLGCTVVCFLWCTMLFSGNVFWHLSDSSDINARTTDLRYVGLFSLLFSMTIGLLVTISAEVRGEVDFPALVQTGVRRLEEKIPEGSEV